MPAIPSLMLFRRTLFDHQCAHAIRMSSGKEECIGATQRIADQNRGFACAKMIQQCGDVAEAARFHPHRMEGDDQRPFPANVKIG